VPSVADGIELRPPAKRGDLSRAAREGARVIGLIDGVFDLTLAVTPAEVHDAAACGVELYGGASMGALRACECPQSMQGVGEIWAAYVAGDIRDDDEVAMTFMPGSYEVIAYPLVQVREVVRLAVELRPDLSRELDAFFHTVQARSFQERTMTAINDAAEPLVKLGLSREVLLQWMTLPEFDRKRRDAVQVLDVVTTARATPPRPHSS